MKREVLKELPLSAAALTGGMLQEYQQLLVEEMLPYQIEILEQGGALDMIRRAPVTGCRNARSRDGPRMWASCWKRRPMHCFCGKTWR